MESKRIRSAIAYLFNNPVEKQLCRRAEDYRWNFLSYYAPYKFQKSDWRRYMSRTLHRAVNVVDGAFEKGDHMKYALLKKLYKGLTETEQDSLTDYIIRRYLAFDAERTCGYFKSYDDMVLAINSNTGSEYEISEMHYCKTDIPYREIIRCLREAGIDDPKSLITSSPDEKKHHLSFLKSRTSASITQIRKFLHINQTSLQNSSST